MLRTHQAHRLRLALCAAAILFSFTKPALAETLVSPRWDVWVVDEAGQPVAGINVTLIREDYSCEAVDHSETLFTDAQGHVQFRPRYLKWSPFKCAYYMTSGLMPFTHHEHGRHAGVTAGDPNGALFGKALDKAGHPIDWTGSPNVLTTHMTVRRRKPAK